MRQFYQKRKKIVIIAVVIVIVVMAIFIIGAFDNKKDSKANIKVQNTIKLEKMNLTSSVSATGTVESSKTKLVSADLQDVKVKKVLVSEGDSVKKGQRLVTFERSDLVEAVDEAKQNLSDIQSTVTANIASANRKLAEAQETYISQKKLLTSSVKQAKKQYLSLKKKYSKANGEEKTKIKEELDKAKQSYDQAIIEKKNSLSQCKSNISSAADNVTNEKNNNKRDITEAKKTLREAKKTLAKCSVTAPMDGVVTAVGVEAGDKYNGADMFEISDCNNLSVTTTVTEYDIAKIKKGQRVVIKTEATDDMEIEGDIDKVAMTTGSTLTNNSQSSGDSTGTQISSNSSSSSTAGYEVKIKIKDKNKVLRVGMTAKCSIILKEKKDVFAVPYDAVHEKGKNESVIYVKDSTGTIAVTKGMESDYYVEISGDDLTEGLEVIIPSDKTSSGTDSEESENDSLKIFGGNKRMENGENRSNKMPEGGAPVRPGM